MGDEGGGAMMQQEVARAEAPEDADAGQTTIAGCLQVDIAVAYVDGLLLPHPKLAKGLENGIGSGFLTDALSLVFTNGNLDLRKEMTDKVLGGCHHLIAHHSESTAALLQLVQHLSDAGIGTGGVERVLHIMLAEGGKGGLELWVLSTIGHSALHQQADAIAHKATYGINAMGGHIVSLQGIVDGGGQVMERIKQRAVEVENVNVIH